MVTGCNFTKFAITTKGDCQVVRSDEIRKLSKDFKNFKDKIVEKMTSDAKAASISSTPPNEKDVQFN